MTLLFVTGMISARASAQCATQWLGGDEVPGVAGTVRATTTYDPDGAGPATPLLVVAGEFTVAGDTVASNIATYDPLLALLCQIPTAQV